MKSQTLSPATSAADKRPIGIFPLVISIFSFIPLLGVLVGLSVIVYGLFKRTTRGYILIGIGTAGILSSVAIYGSLFYAMQQPTGTFAMLQTRLMSEKILPDLVKAVEFYRLQNSSYPVTLDLLDESVKSQFQLSENSPLGSIYYEVSADGTSYYLLQMGPDKQPFTADDIMPKLPEQGLQNTGYRIKP